MPYTGVSNGNSIKYCRKTANINVKNFRFITSVRPIVHDTYKTAKINFINSGAVDIIRTVYYIHGPELMKLIFAILYVS